MKIQFTKILEAGYAPAMLGLSLSHEQDVEGMPEIALRLINPKLRDSHNKFREMMMTWWDVWLPRKVWVQFATYRVGVSTSSGSTMFNIMKRPITQDDFVDGDILLHWLWDLNKMRDDNDLKKLKDHLPEGYMQRRIVMMNYQSLNHVINDRTHHKLEEWQGLIADIHSQLDHPEFINW